MRKDHVDSILEQWARERPDIDTSPMGVIARISRLSRLVEQEYGKAFASFGLTQSSFTVLAALRRSGPPYRLSPTRLYSSLLVSSGAMTNRIDRLEERGLVERIADAKDRRGVLVGLTPKGRELIDETVVALVSVEQEMLKALSQRERDQLAGLLRRLAAEIETDSFAVNRPHRATADRGSSGGK